MKYLESKKKHRSVYKLSCKDNRKYMSDKKTLSKMDGFEKK